MPPGNARNAEPFLAHVLSRVLLFFRQHPVRSIVGTCIVLFIFVLTASRGHQARPQGGKGSFGVALSPVAEEEFRHAMVRRYEERFDELTRDVAQEHQAFKSEVAQIRSEVDSLGKKIEHELDSLRQAVTQQQAEKLEGPAQPAPVPGLRHILPADDKGRRIPAPQPQEQRRRQVQEIPPATFVELPAGSFVDATFLTGVFAPADLSRPLPVLIRVNEGFIGPNHSRIPLEGCFALGKAAADLGSERATVQIATLSCTLPSGDVFERHEPEVSGYVAGADGNFGVPGQLIRKDTQKLGMSALTGFLAGAGEALARAESTVIVSPFIGTTTTSVQGNISKYAAYSGLAKTANQLARYYLELARHITPAIHVPSEEQVHIVMTKGVTIEGLTPQDVQAEPVRYSPARR